MKIKMPENYHTIDTATRFEIVKISEFEFEGKIVNAKGEVVMFLGMPQDNIGYSHNYNTTYSITEKAYNELV